MNMESNTYKAARMTRWLAVLGMAVVVVLAAGCDLFREASEPEQATTGVPMQEPTLATAVPMQEPTLATEAPMQEPTLATAVPMQEPTLATEAPMQEPTLATEAPMQEPTLATAVPMQEPTLATAVPMQEPTLATGAPMQEPTQTAFEEINFTSVTTLTGLPSQVQIVFSLRDQNGHSIVLPAEEIKNAARVYERGETDDDWEEIDYSETSFFVHTAENFQLEVVFVLDFTNSMAQATLPDGGSGIDAMMREVVSFV